MRIERYKAIYDDLADQIRRGALPAGTRLPTHRALAKRHGIALATATKVYRELTAAGLVVGEPGRGTFVRDLSGFAGLEPRRLARGQRVADLSFNQPLTAGQDDDLRRALRELATEGDLAALLMQQPPGGRYRDQAAVATYLLDRDIDVPPASVVLTGGAQHALDTVLGALTAPGTVVAVEAVSYPGMKLLANAHRLDVAPVRTGTSGMDVDHLEWLCGQRPIALLYVQSSLQNPLGFVLSAEVRAQIATLARRHDFIIVEDGTYAFLEPAAPPPIQTLAADRTVYVGSMSKNLAPGLRVGYIVTPAAHRSALISRLRAGSWGTSTIANALATRWLSDGTVQRLEKRRREDALHRQTIAQAQLAGLDYHAHPRSLFGWVNLPEDARSDIVARDLALRGIFVSTADAFATTAHAPNALRIALATPDHDTLTHALRVVHETVTHC